MTHLRRAGHWGVLAKIAALRPFHKTPENGTRDVDQQAVVSGLEIDVRPAIHAFLHHHVHAVDAAGGRHRPEFAVAEYGSDR